MAKLLHKFVRITVLWVHFIAVSVIILNNLDLLMNPETIYV